MKTNQKKIPLVYLISLSFISLLLTTGGIVGWVNYSGMKSMLLSSTAELVKRSGESTLSELTNIYNPVGGIVRGLAYHPIANTRTTQERLSYLPYLRTQLELEDAISAIYLGFGDGSFFLLRIIGTSYKPSFEIPKESRFLAQTIETYQDRPPLVLFYFYNENLDLISTFVPENYDYDPRTRDWYTLAKAKSNLIHTEPYVFFTTKEVGKSISIPAGDRETVIGADVTLGALSDLLIKQKLTPSTQLVLMDTKKNAIAYTEPSRLFLSSEDNKLKLAKLQELGSPILKLIEKQFNPSAQNASQSISYSSDTWMTYTSKLTIESEEDHYLILLSPEEELLSDAKDNLTKTLGITFGILIFSLPIVFLVSRAISRSMTGLTEYTNAIQNFDFSGGLPKDSRISELDTLSRTVGIMKNTIQKFLDISAILTAEKDFEKLMKHILSETAAACGVPAAVLYIMSIDEKLLEVGAIYLGDGTAIQIESLPEIPLEEESNTFPIHKVIQNNKVSVLPLPRIAFINELSFFGQERENDFPFVIGVPLKNQDKQLIGVLCLFDTQDISQNASQLSFVENLSGTTSVAIENHRILETQKHLFDTFLQSLSSLIDEKSSYSSKHCSRVPELAMLLADAVAEQEGGTFNSFLLSPEDRETFRIAAYLHDIGKIRTPEYIVEKSTKLETISDRIHEVRLRFEVLKRELLISYYKKNQAGENWEQLIREYERESKILDEEYFFLASCNDGSLELDSEKIERIKKISQRCFEKSLDDTLGISQEEKQKKLKKKKVSNLEYVLSDRPEHIVEHMDSEKIGNDNPWNFSMKIPRYRFNRGEIHNLTVQSGVHTEEEQFVMNSHILDTIKFLEALPLTGYLKSVPEIAGGHHERLDGSGFPRKLQKEEMSIQARILCIAEIFEYLSSSENPYKKAKTLSSVIEDMDRMRKQNFIDGELFEIFLSSGVFMEYARQNLQAHQMDRVEISRYITKS